MLDDYCWQCLDYKGLKYREISYSNKQRDEHSLLGENFITDLKRCTKIEDASTEDIKRKYTCGQFISQITNKV